MIIDNIRYHIFSDVLITTFKNEKRVIIFEGDPSAQNMDPAIINMTVVCMHATKLGRIEILVSEEVIKNV